MNILSKSDIIAKLDVERATRMVEAGGDCCVKDTLHNLSRRRHLRIRAVCGVANPRASYG